MIFFEFNGGIDEQTEYLLHRLGGTRPLVAIHRSGNYFFLPCWVSHFQASLSLKISNFQTNAKALVDQFYKRFVTFIDLAPEIVEPVSHILSLQRSAGHCFHQGMGRFETIRMNTLFEDRTITHAMGIVGI